MPRTPPSFLEKRGAKNFISWVYKTGFITLKSKSHPEQRIKSLSKTSNHWLRFLKRAGTSATAAGGGSREREEWPRSKSARISADAPAAIFGNRNR